MKYVATHCKAPNDVNGNPRRLFMVSEVMENGSDLVAVLDEGYNGNDAFRKYYPEAVMLTSIEISAKEYKRLLKLI